MKKTRITLIIGFILGVIITTLTAVVYASNTLFESKDISYTNDKTEVNNVKDAVDELYYKLENIHYLADVVSVGDYVAYDAGTWTETKDMPTSQGQFGGYTKGDNKANSVSKCHFGLVTLKGWRVFSIDKNTKIVTLVHAGQPECYYHAYGYSEVSVTNLNNRAASGYLNIDYADSVHMMTKGEADQNILRKTNDYYWLANAYDASTLWNVNNLGDIDTHNGGSNGSIGVRPVVVLKPNILTTGKGTDMVGQEAWTLVKP